MRITKETAEQILKVIVEAFPLGSTNIAPITQSKSIHDDRIFINTSLFFRKQRQKTVDSLVDYSLPLIAKERLNTYFQDEGIERVDLEYKQLKPTFDRYALFAKYICIAATSMVANCFHMCGFGLYYLSKNQHLIKGQSVELMSFSRTLDHYVLILNRDPSIPIDNTTLLNKKHILVIDPWLNLVMTFEEFEKFWKKNFPLISSKQLANFYEIPTYKTRGKRIPAKIDFKLIKHYDIKDLKKVSLETPKFFPESKSISL